MGESPEPIKSTLDNLKERWQDVKVLLDERKRTLHHATLRKEFADELKRLQDVIGGAEKWLAEQEPVADDIQSITQQLDQCKVNLTLISPTSQISCHMARLDYSTYVKSITYLRAKTNINQGKSGIIAKRKSKLYLEITKNTNTIIICKLCSWILIR